jgi:hypothetical protein
MYRIPRHSRGKDRDIQSHEGDGEGKGRHHGYELGATGIVLFILSNSRLLFDLELLLRMAGFMGICCGLYTGCVGWFRLSWADGLD